MGAATKAGPAGMPCAPLTRVVAVAAGRGAGLARSPGPAAGEGTNQEQVSPLSPFLPPRPPPPSTPLSFRERFSLIFK